MITVKPEGFECGDGTAEAGIDLGAMAAAGGGAPAGPGTAPSPAGPAAARLQNLENSGHLVASLRVVEMKNLRSGLLIKRSGSSPLTQC